MANTIVLKRSSMAAKVPLTTDLSLGELAINTYDGKVYIKKNDGADAIVEITKANLANVTGNLDLATHSTGSAPHVNIVNDGGTNAVFYPVFTSSYTAGAGDQTLSMGGNLQYNPSTATLTCPIFAGNATTASNATAVSVTNSVSGATFYPTFANSTGTGQTVWRNTNLSYVPSTGTLTATAFVGSLTGNADTATTATSATSATKSTNIVGGNSTTLLGSIPYQSNTDTTTLLAPNTTATQKFLAMTGTGTNGAAPSWQTVSVSPAGSTGQIQYNNASAFGAAGGILINSAGDFEFVQQASPVVPSNNNNLTVYKSNSAYPTLAVKHPALGIGNAADDLLQAQFGSKDIGWWNPPGNATSVPGILGITAPTANGTATARTTASTSAVNRTRRLGYVTTAAINLQAGQSWTVRQWTFGDGSGLGGFYMIYRFAVSDVSLVSTGRWSFVGMTTQSGPLTALPTTACFGMIQQVGGTNWFMRVAGGSLGTDVDLGANFPIDLTSVYEVRLFSSPNDTTTVQYEVIRLNTGHTAVGSFSTTGLSFNSGTLMAPQAIRSTGATQATAVGLDIMSLYIEKTF